MAEEIFELRTYLFNGLRILGNLYVLALTPVSNLIEYFLQELNLEAWFLVQKCEGILNDFLTFVVHEFY